MRKVVQIFSYCGVTKEEYNSVKEDAYVSNFQVWLYLHIFIGITFYAFYLQAIFYDGYSFGSTIKLAMFFYCAVISILFTTKTIKPESIIGQFVIYLTMILLLLSTFYMGMQQENTISVSFIILLVLLPMFMIDRPFYMAIVLIIASFIYLYFAKMYKTIDIIRLETINVITYCILGIIINTFYNTLRIKEFLLVHKAQKHVENQIKALEETEKLNSALQKMSASLIEVLGDVVEGRDSGSGNHVQRVKGFTHILANQVMEDLPEYGLTPHKVEMMTFASSLHDVGKISIPDSVLLKDGKLTPDEIDIMKTHCKKGCDILRKMSGSWHEEYLQIGLDICEYHHERWDGNGYPNGLKGDEIPITAQIVSLADTYDALTSERSYKRAYSCDEAFEMIIRGECGQFSNKLMNCFKKCKRKFEAFFYNPQLPEISGSNFEIIGSKRNVESSFVVGFHDQTKTLQENIKLNEELSVVSSLSDLFYYICYVDMKNNEVYRFKADKAFSQILDSLSPELKSNEKFDKLLNTIIVADDYDSFRAATDREKAMQDIEKYGHKTVNFSIRLEDGVHHCKMKITPDQFDSNAMIIGIMNADEEYNLELLSAGLKQELENTMKEIEGREKLQDQLSVINNISSDYDYIFTLDAETMAVTEYRSSPWMRDMLKNMEEIVISPEARARAMKGIVHSDDFQSFLEASKHESVLAGLHTGGGIYNVNYRGYKYGRLVHYQNRYIIDKEHPNRIIIGIHCVDDCINSSQDN